MFLPHVKRYFCALAVAVAFAGVGGNSIAKASSSPAAPAPTAAAAPEPVPNANCLECHGKPGAKSEKTGRAIGIDMAKFEASIHGKKHVECIECHTDLTKETKEHEPKLKPTSCVSCHEDEVKEYQASAHSKARDAGNSVAATCADCHGAHDILKAKELASKTNFKNVEAACGACHGNDAMIEKGHIPGGNIRNMYHDSVHGKLTAEKGRASEAPTCTSCHGAHSVLGKDDAASKVSKKNVVDTCASCHKEQFAVYSKSLHGRNRLRGKFSAPSCVDCHSPHQIQRHDLTAFQTEVINECGNCHAEQIATYRDTFHGQVTALGYSRIATCASCHGSHNILPASNPESKISEGRLVNTCQQCHKSANANFAMYQPHGNTHDRERFPLLYWTKTGMVWLLIGVFSFFGLHTLLWFIRSLRDLRERANQASHSNHSND
jgi:hypothetical protein